MTNKEKLNQKSDMEFDHWLANNSNCETCSYPDFEDCEGYNCLSCFNRWLESEMEK